MIAIFGMVCCMAIASGGYLVAVGDIVHERVLLWVGVVMVGMGSLALALLTAVLRAGLSSGQETDRPVTLGLLNSYVMGNDDLVCNLDTAVYLANPDIAPATGLFVARIDGRRVLVIEREAQ